MPNHRILFISKGETKSPTRYRALDYFSRFEQAGWTPIHRDAAKSLGGRRSLLKDVANADVVVILRKTFSVPYRYLLRKYAKHLVFDLDDAIFLNDNGTPSGQRMRNFRGLLGRCDLAWAGNQYLADACLASCPDVITAPTSIDPAIYDVTPKKPDDTLDLVWIGSSSTRKYLETLVPILERAASDFSNLRLKIIADFDLPSPRLKTISIPWTRETEATEIASSHVGLAPMSDDPWTRGKCGLKVLQYMAARLPVIASASGVHHDILEGEQIGYLAQSPDQWIDAIKTLHADSARREKMGNAGRKRLVANYSLDSTFAILLESLNRLVSDS
ncbi:MAG: glycosyltransferase family 4 protein [Planctomycetota bacterium]|nr:glycosyltransferase family 4 protein [Planctomycetota bacterium]